MAHARVGVSALAARSFALAPRNAARRRPHSEHHMLASNGATEHRWCVIPHLHRHGRDERSTQQRRVRQRLGRQQAQNKVERHACGGTARVRQP